jgi:hypothetical protein
MIAPQPDQQRRTGRDAADSTAMETFTVGAPQWLVMLFSRNPLIRLSDRIEVLAVVLVVTVSLLALPVGAAVGTATYESRSSAYAEQAQSQTVVTATVLDRGARSDATNVPARWFAAGSEHAGVVKAHPDVKPGELIEIPVASDGSYANPPAMSAANEAVAVALAIWLNVTVAALLVFAGVRGLLNRSRRGRWEADFAQLSGGNGHSSRA